MKNVRTIAASTIACLHYSKSLKPKITTWIESRATTSLFIFRTSRLKVSVFVKLVINRVGKHSIEYLLTKMSRDALIHGHKKLRIPIIGIVERIRVLLQNNLN